MIPATEPRTPIERTRMLVVDRTQKTFRDAFVTELPAILRPNDLVVVNDAATLPASLFAKLPDGSPIEIRLLQHEHDGDWKAVLLGAGDWRTPTELRDPPDRLTPGAQLEIAKDLSVIVADIAADNDRLVTLRFPRSGVAMWTAIYAYGHPIQYSYLKSDLDLWSVQTAYAARPWAAEMPSAGRPLTWRILLELKRRGIAIASLTHAAGISAAGDEDLDSRLPLAERFEIPSSTVDAIRNTHAAGGRVIAIGTTVVRALEGCAVQHGGELKSGAGETSLVIQASFRCRVVDGLLTGVHDPSQSHFRLLRAFADETLLRRAWRHATAENYRCHEFGDVCLIL